MDVRTYGLKPGVKPSNGRPDTEWRHVDGGLTRRHIRLVNGKLYIIWMDWTPEEVAEGGQ